MTLQARQGQVTVTRQNAADDLAVRLKEVADALVRSGVRPKRVAYGPARGAGLIKRRSPKGFVLDAAGQRLQVLLPDGRLWHYHERCIDEGIYYDPHIDHARANHGSIPLKGSRFSYLGALIGKYHFGYRHHDDQADRGGFEVGALINRDGAAPRYVPADEAFAEIINGL